ncbi:MAG: protein kinase, partial [Polyangiales bacterium]
MVARLEAEGGPDTGAIALPRAFGPYLLFDRIGRGGMAEIFLARSRNELGGSRRIVIKEVLPELSSDPSFARMLVREAKLAARLSHGNVVQVIDLGRECGRLFIAMAYVEGYDLNHLLRQLSKR